MINTFGINSYRDIIKSSKLDFSAEKNYYELVLLFCVCNLDITKLVTFVVFPNINTNKQCILYLQDNISIITIYINPFIIIILYLVIDKQ